MVPRRISPKPKPSNMLGRLENKQEFFTGMPRLFYLYRAEKRSWINFMLTMPN